MEKVKELEWVGAILESGEKDIVQAHPNGHSVLNGVVVLTKGLIGAKFGSCFDMMPVNEPAAREKFLQETELVLRYGDKWEKPSLWFQKQPSRKKQKTEEKKNNDASADRSDLFQLVPTDIKVGVYKSAPSELEYLRQDLASQLAVIEKDLGLVHREVNAAEDTARVKSNRNRIEDVTSQRLTQDEITTMLKEGLPADQIIEKVCDSHATFGEMTEYAQKKYTEKKLQKYSRKFRIVPLTAQFLGETLWNHRSFCSNKLGDFRPMDTLPQILGLANIQAGSKALVVDGLMGLLAGAVLERLAGEGQVISGYINHEDSLRLVDFLPLSPQEKGILTQINLPKLVDGSPGNEFCLVQGRRLVLIEQQLGVLQGRLGDASAAGSEELVAEIQKEKELFERIKDGISRRVQLRQVSEDKQAKAFRFLRESGADCLIVASNKLDPVTTTLALMPFLAPARPFVVYSKRIEPLEQLREDLKSDVINMCLTETMLAYHQVLPGRTHPHMSSSAVGGYLLSGISLGKPVDDVKQGRGKEVQKLSKFRQEKLKKNETES